ncbi:MAG: NERD domain-containing protein [Mycobacteriales bacterium]
MDFEMDRAAESGVAREVAARQKAARLRAQQRGLEQEAQRLEAFADQVEKGNAGERLTAARLDILDGAGWRVLNDRKRLPGSVANIDHVVVGPPGVLVIDSKHWNARVQWSDRGLYADGYSRAREVSALTQAAGDVRATSRLVVPGVPVVEVLCFTRDVGLTAPRAVDGTVALELRDLLHWMTSQPGVLNPQQIHRLGSSLDAAFPPRTSRGPALTGASAAAKPRRTAPAPVGARPSTVRPSPVRRPVHSRQRSWSSWDVARTVIGVIVALLLLSGTYSAVMGPVSQSVSDRITPSPPPSTHAPLIPPASK